MPLKNTEFVNANLKRERGVNVRDDIGKKYGF
jgi:hypothetical protein